MNTKAPIYRFASLRNPNSEYSSSDIEYVEIETQLISTLSEIVESDISKDEKLAKYNEVLQQFVNSDEFLKSKKPFKSNFVFDGDNAKVLEILYNNIIVRTLTKSTNNQIYKLLIDRFKEEYLENTSQSSKIEITIPESITPSFITYNGENKEQEEEDETENKKLLERQNALAKAELLLIQARNNAIISFGKKGNVNKVNVEYQNILSFVGKDNVDLSDAKETVEKAIRAQEKEQNETKIFNRELNINEKSTISDELQNSPEINIRMLSFLERRI